MKEINKEEILKELPHYIHDRNHRGYPFELWINKHNGDWNVGYETAKGFPLKSVRAKTLAEASAKMYLYLKEEKLI